MRAKRIIRSLVAIFLAMLFIKMLLSGTTVEAQSIQSGDVNRDDILDASVQISMSIFLKPAGESQSNSNTSGDKIIANGIGSLIQDHGKALLVTHNHWGEALQDASLVELRDADNGLLLRLFGFEFKERIAFQDAGTMILEAPREIVPFPSSTLPTFQSSVLPTLQPSTVQVTYRQGSGRQQLGVLDAEVLAIEAFKGLAALKLRSLDGQPLLQGDSGGGVWLGGKLVGNSWATLVTGARAANTSVVAGEDGSQTVFTDLSYAALLDR